jgi:hypothetical protein
MKRKTALLLMTFLSITCCTTSKFVSLNTEIGSLYKFGYISELLKYGGSPSLYGMDVEIFQLIGKAGIKMLGEGEIEKLTNEAKSKLFVIKYGVSSSFLESVVTISFFDYKSTRPLLNCTGASCWGFPGIDIPAAKKNALRQMRLALKL